MLANHNTPKVPNQKLPKAELLLLITHSLSSSTPPSPTHHHITHTHTHQGGRATSCYTTDKRAPYMHNTAEPWQHGSPRQKSNTIYLHLSMGVTCLKCCSAQICYKWLIRAEYSAYMNPALDKRPAL